MRGRYKHEGTEKWFHGSVVGITCRRGRSMFLLVRYDGEDEAVDEAWPSEDLEVLAPEEDVAMAEAVCSRCRAGPSCRGARGRRAGGRGRAAAQETGAEGAHARRRAGPRAGRESRPPSRRPRPASAPPAESKGRRSPRWPRRRRERLEKRRRRRRRDSDSSDDEPIGLVAGPRV